MTDFDKKALTLTARAKALRDEIARTDDEMVEALGKTAELLTIAAQHKVRTVSIGKKHSAVDNESWPFGYSGSVFTPKSAEVDGWPAAWRIVDEAGISQGAGNTGQHGADTTGLIDGVYELRAGHWRRIDGVTA
ncbi:hypothetical protein [Curtobacterium poinsettiae]|uniref:hypothetical protein n=1 Tax=Curtobacterium poinsettiae TaxID=159612 RepID=UPI00217E7A8D|nr:hypothetical protein [Curtobacterium flaccumfaciens]MCS6578228.1 hypothetical protein [Curtobacterium flaccumfaciens]